MSIFFAVMLAGLVSILILDGAKCPSTGMEFLNGLPGLSGPLRFKRSKASNSASENCLRCLGRKGTGVETREDKNYQRR